MNTPDESSAFLKSRTLLPVSIGTPRDLNQEDMNRHALREPETGALAPLRSIRNSHHMLARMLAEDRTPAEISAVLGYAPSRVKILEEDPSIRELVAHYRARHDAESADIFAQVQNLTINAMQELAERLELDPEDFTKDELLKIVQNGLDRIGYGPQSKVKVTHVDVAGVISAIKSHNTTENRVLTREEAEALYETKETPRGLISQDS